MNNRILLSAVGIGRAHSKRTLALAKRLQEEGYDIYLCLGRRDCKIARQNGFQNVYLVQEVSWIENQYGVDVIRSGLNILLPTLHKSSLIVEYKSSLIVEFVRRYVQERNIKNKIKPRVLVSDGDIAMLRVGKRWHEKYVFVTNVLRPQYKGFFRAVAKLPQYLSERYMKGAEEIEFADLPPPKTISLYNLGNWKDFSNLKFVGPFTDMRRPEGVEDKKFIYVMAGGTDENRIRFFRTIKPVLDEYCRKSGYTWKMALGLTGGLIEKTDLHEVYRYVDQETMERFQNECSFVLHRGTHLACLESIAKEKPSLIVPTKDQVEQEANARRMQELGLGVSVEESELEGLPQAIERMMNEREDYSRRLREFREYAEEFNGLEKAVEHIKSLLS